MSVASNVNLRRTAGTITLVAAVAVAGIWVVNAVRRPAGDGLATPLIEAPAPDTVYNPVLAGEQLPDGYRVALPRDAILPVYNPEFVGAAEVDWPEDMLVIGVASDRTAKAYPLTHLNSREMVIDSLDGIPILVSW